MPHFINRIPVSKKDKKPAHLVQHELLTGKPYTLGHGELILEHFLLKEGIIPKNDSEKQEIWNKLFSKGHPCLRASALIKRYGFGAHYNEQGKLLCTQWNPKNTSNFYRIIP